MTCYFFPFCTICIWVKPRQRYDFSEIIMSKLEASIILKKIYIYLFLYGLSLPLLFYFLNNYSARIYTNVSKCEPLHWVFFFFFCGFVQLRYLTVFHRTLTRLGGEHTFCCLIEMTDIGGISMLNINEELIRVKYMGDIDYVVISKNRWKRLVSVAVCSQLLCLFVNMRTS